MELDILYQLLLAILLGALIGLEREIKRKGAGLQTYTLVSLGSCLFTIVAVKMFEIFIAITGANFDPSRIIQAVAIGIGFVAAGVVFRQEAGIAGLTTAAGLWVTAAIGVIAGVKLYTLAIIATILSLLVLIVFGSLEKRIFEKKQ
ncbi:MAG: MgtC/SapB family protein [Patescibacteria group bacterium]